jgi:phage-related protein
MNKYKIQFYQDKDGNIPIVDYINELNRKAAKSKAERVRLNKIYEYFDILSAYGTRAGVPYTKHIDGSIWELRPTNDRLFYFYWQDNTYLILHHFIKKSQKTPIKEIEKAKRNLSDFLERNKLL